MEEVPSIVCVFRISGAWVCAELFPALMGWANVWRASGAVTVSDSPPRGVGIMRPLWSGVALDSTIATRP